MQHTLLDHWNSQMYLNDKAKSHIIRITDIVARIHQPAKVINAPIDQVG